MPLLSSDDPIGNPAFGLGADQVATVVDLICRGAEEARPHIEAKMLEVPITMVVRKAVRRVKVALGLTNLEIRGEHELEDMSTMGPEILGRIDITMKFTHQFGFEDAYVPVECKRVAAGDSTLNANYVVKGVQRYVAGQYGSGLEWGFMLGYVLKPPVNDVVEAIDASICHHYGTPAKLATCEGHPLALALLEGTVLQNGAHPLRLKHVFVEMSAAA